MKSVAIVLAAGSGKRMGTAVKKQYLDVGGHPVLFYSLEAFEKSMVDEIILVASADDIDDVKREYMNGTFTKLTTVVEGGKERYNSVYNGLCAAKDCDYVFIHDGARPFVDCEIIERCMNSLLKGESCVAAVPSKDTIKIADESGYVVSTPDRRLVWNIQTPQCFAYNVIFEAYSLLIKNELQGELGNLHITDDAMVASEFVNERIKLIEGSYNNIKITTISDLPLAEAILAEKNH